MLPLTASRWPLALQSPSTEITSNGSRQTHGRSLSCSRACVGACMCGDTVRGGLSWQSLYERRESFQVIVTVKKGTRDCLSLASSQNNKTPTCTRPQVAGKVFKFREECACESPSYDQNTRLTASQTGGGLFPMATSKRRIKTEKARSKCPSYLQFCLQK